MKRAAPGWRPLHGVLLFDKPAGLSSNQALQQVRRLYRAEKGGHTGSLDPLATGLLPICFGEATKIAGWLLGSDKAYETTARLGVCTDSDDAAGSELQRRAVPALTRADVEAALCPLLGRIRQRPPVYSAIKRDGVPAYRRARAGEAVELPEREVTVQAIEVLELAGDALRLRIECGSGTYVRSLVRDLGEALGCGAHVEALRRLWVDPFRQPEMLDLTQLEHLDPTERDARLLPIERALGHLPGLPVDAAAATRLRHGQSLPASAPEGLYVLWEGATAVGRGRVDATGRLHPERIFHAMQEDGSGR